jgi:hypothetical protein
VHRGKPGIKLADIADFVLGLRAPPDNGGRKGRQLVVIAGAVGRI